jgi:hypothetical protein
MFFLFEIKFFKKLIFLGDFFNFLIFFVKIFIIREKL